MDKNVIEFKEKRILKLTLVLIFSIPFVFFIWIARNIFEYSLYIFIYMVFIFAMSTKKHGIVINSETIMFYSKIWNLGTDEERIIEISWNDIQRIGYKKVFFYEALFIYYPYNDKKIKDGDIAIDFSYYNYKIAWKEVVLRTKAANPDVEIAEEFLYLLEDEQD